jgi:serine/threonine protein kinase
MASVAAPLAGPRTSPHYRSVDHEADTQELAKIIIGEPEPSIDLDVVSAIAEVTPEGQLKGVREVATPPPAADTPVPRIGPYELVVLFRSSPFARVFLAHKTSPFGTLGSAVVKWVPRSHPDFEACREMLIDEGRAMALIDHANVVKVLDLDELPTGVYLAMEYVPGPDLRTLLDVLARRDERMPHALSAYLVSGVLRGLHQAHFTQDFRGVSTQMIHRDVNPSNILVSSSGAVKLADFGVVRMRSRIQAATQPGIVKGKFRYMAPEYVTGQDCTLQTDVYSMGVTAYELLAGVMPLADLESMQALRVAVEVGISTKPLEKMGVPTALVEVVQRAVARKPDDRWATAGAMADALDAWLDRSGRHVDAHVLATHLRARNLARPEVRGRPRAL